MKTAAGKSAGRAETSMDRAWTPPAEAPMTIVSRVAMYPQAFHALDQEDQRRDRNYGDVRAVLITKGS